MLGNRTKLRFLRGHHCAVLLNRLTPHIRRRNGSLSILTLQRGTLAHRSRPRKVPSSKSAVIRRGRYRISPKRGWARCNRNLIRKKLLFILTFGVRMRTNLFAICITKPKRNLLKADKMTTLVARLDNAPRQNRVFGKAHFARSRAASKRLSCRRGSTPGNPSAACMKKARLSVRL